MFRPSLFTIYYFLAHYSLFIIKKGHYSLIIIPQPDPHTWIILVDFQSRSELLNTKKVVYYLN